jgi:iduronate 2-sulfatase
VPSHVRLRGRAQPDHTRAWNFIQYFREARPDAVSFPQYFKNTPGYLALGAGKLYHTDNPPNHDVPASWSPEQTADLAGLGPQSPGVVDGGPGKMPKEAGAVSCDLSKPGVAQDCYYEPLWHRCTGTASTFCVNDTAANAEDGSTAALTVTHLQRAKKAGKKFYVGCGFHRPHAAYISTQEAWSHYDGQPITAAKHQTMHPSVPDVAMIVNFGIGLENGSHYQWDPRDKPVPVAVQLEVRRHYYAAITFMDVQVPGDRSPLLCGSPFLSPFAGAQLQHFL